MVAVEKPCRFGFVIAGPLLWQRSSDQEGLVGVGVEFWEEILLVLGSGQVSP